VFDDRLAKKWKCAEVMLFQAAEFIQAPNLFTFTAKDLKEYNLDLREIEISEAMNELAIIGEQSFTKPAFWRRLKKVAVQIDNSDKADLFEIKFHQALLKNV